jgi:hypothetical protein
MQPVIRAGQAQQRVLGQREQTARAAVLVVARASVGTTMLKPSLPPTRKMQTSAL